MELLNLLLQPASSSCHVTGLDTLPFPRRTSSSPAVPPGGALGRTQLLTNPVTQRRHGTTDLLRSDWLTAKISVTTESSGAEMSKSKETSTVVECRTGSFSQLLSSNQKQAAVSTATPPESVMAPIHFN